MTGAKLPRSFWRRAGSPLTTGGGWNAALSVGRAREVQGQTARLQFDRSRVNHFLPMSLEMAEDGGGGRVVILTARFAVRPGPSHQLNPLSSENWNA